MQKLQIWRNFAKVVDEMIRANKSTQLQGPEILAKMANLLKVAILAKFRQGYNADKNFGKVVDKNMSE